MLSRFFLALVACLMFGVGVPAQEFPKAELFGGYSYGNFSPTFSGEGRTSVNGWNASLGVNLNRWFGLVTDFGGHYGSASGQLNFLPLVACVPAGCPSGTFSEDDKYHSFLFGPQFSLRARKATPFVHALFGGTRFNRSGVETLTIPPSPPSTFHFLASNTGFSFAGGGGVDYKFTDSLSWRFQADYLQVGIPGRTLNNVRVSTGVVFHF